MRYYISNFLDYLTKATLTIFLLCWLSMIPIALGYNWMPEILATPMAYVTLFSSIYTIVFVFGITIWGIWNGRIL